MLSSTKRNLVTPILTVFFLSGCNEESPWNALFDTTIANAIKAHDSPRLDEPSSTELISPDTGDALKLTVTCERVDMLTEQPSYVERGIEKSLDGKSLPYTDIILCYAYLNLCDRGKDCGDTTPKYEAGLNYLKNVVGEKFNVKINAATMKSDFGEVMPDGRWRGIPQELGSKEPKLLEADVSHFGFGVATISQKAD